MSPFAPKPPAGAKPVAPAPAPAAAPVPTPAPPATDVGEEIVSTRFPMLDVMLFGFVLLAIRFLAEGYLFSWMPKVMAAIPMPLWTFGLPVLGAILVMAGTRRVVTRISEAESAILVQGYFLFFVPAGTSRFSFGQIRVVDLYHPGDVGGADPSPVLFIWNMWLYLILYFMPGPGAVQRYEIRALMQDRTRITICSGYGDERMADLATRISRITKARLG